MTAFVEAEAMGEWEAKLIIGIAIALYVAGMVGNLYDAIVKGSLLALGLFAVTYVGALVACSSISRPTESDGGTVI